MFSTETLHFLRGAFAGASLSFALLDDFFFCLVFFLLWAGLKCYTTEAFSHGRRN
jgi:hypothetical protein